MRKMHNCSARILDSYVLLFEVIADKNTTIARLRKLIFGSSTEKAETLQCPSQEPEALPDSGAENAGSANTGSDGESSEADANQRPRNHGRRARTHSPGLSTWMSRTRHCAGDGCPECLLGTVYDKNPCVVVRFVGRTPIQGTVFRMQRLRCNLCGKVFTAPSPQEAKAPKYDHTVASMIGLLKAWSGMPFNRLQGLQRSCDIPLAASTQWEIVAAVHRRWLPPMRNTSDKWPKVTWFITTTRRSRSWSRWGKMREKSPPTDDPHDPNRTGSFTSGVVSTPARPADSRVLSGRSQHAGENLSDVYSTVRRNSMHRSKCVSATTRNLPKKRDHLRIV